MYETGLLLQLGFIPSCSMNDTLIPSPFSTLSLSLSLLYMIQYKYIHAAWIPYNKNDLFFLCSFRHLVQERRGPICIDKISGGWSKNQENKATTYYHCHSYTNATGVLVVVLQPIMCIPCHLSLGSSKLLGRQLILLLPARTTTHNQV